MATDNRLSASLPDEQSEEIRDISKQRDIKETEAERAVVRAGLTAMGRLEQPTEPAEIVLYYARKIGTLLGFVGIIMIGYGIFGAAPFRYTGFGLVLAGFGAIAAAEFAPVVSDTLGGDRL